MLAFISMGFAELYVIGGGERKIQNENICTKPDTNLQPFEHQAGALSHSSSLAI